jgi:DNA (cytosine-5)-methyltransferase 1
VKFIDLFAGLGGFHLAMRSLGHDCVFASEIDTELQSLYVDNFPHLKDKTFGDIRKCRDSVPEHDVLCAGFPCQPFSKSGSQLGLDDQIKGTLFDEIVYILDKRRPEYVLLENVGNFERHDGGRTWQIVKDKLHNLGYSVRGTEHLTSGGTGLISPHHLGFPHSRERFFIVARLSSLPANPFPPSDRECKTSLNSIVQPESELTETDILETSITKGQLACIEHWNKLLMTLPEREVPLPSFPMWADEIDATYPFEKYTPFVTPLKELRQCLNGHSPVRLSRKRLLSLLPSYARRQEDQFPKWKIDFIKQNREWFKKYRAYFSEDWLTKLRSFPLSFRKFEWNCKGAERDLWKHVLQFRPSGLRVKRYSTSPSLVAMTSTQIPILGPEKRFLTKIEGLRLQGFPDSHKIPSSRTKTFQALGNAVHVNVVEAIARCLIESDQ